MQKKKIIFEGFSSSQQTTCCLFSNLGTQTTISKQFNKRPQKYFIHNPQQKTTPIKNRQITPTKNELQQVRSRRATVSTLKKSLSGINLKRKNSENQKTNRTYYQPSEIQQNLAKRFVTTSMDAQVFKQYFPQNQIQNRKRSAFLSPTSQSYCQLNKQQQSLESLFVKNQKKKKQENLLKKQDNKFSYYFSNQISSTKATIVNPKNKDEKYFKKQENVNQQKIPSFLRELKERKQLKTQTPNFKSTKQKMFQMNQIQSILINVPSNQQKTCSKMTSKYKKFDKQILQNKTVSSQYQPDESEKKERVQESAILINYFNPPSFIKQKFSSNILNKSKTVVQESKKESGNYLK